MMKRLKAVFLVLIALLLFGTPSGAQVLWRSAGILPKGSAIVMGHFNYADFNKRYVSGKWEQNTGDQSAFGLHMMLGYAPFDGVETLVHLPFSQKNFDSAAFDESYSGIGDIWLKTRIRVLPWKRDKHGFAVIGTVRLPTGSDDEANAFLNTGDGTTDLGIGGIFSSKWVHNGCCHLKLNYWMNGKNDADVDIGNELKFVAECGRNVTPKIMPFIAYFHNKKFENQTADGKNIAGSDIIRNYLLLGVAVKPEPGIVIRPRVLFFTGGKNGTVFSLKPILDLWYIFSF